MKVKDLKNQVREMLEFLSRQDPELEVAFKVDHEWNFLSKDAPSWMTTFEQVTTTCRDTGFNAWAPLHVINSEDSIREIFQTVLEDRPNVEVLVFG